MSSIRSTFPHYHLQQQARQTLGDCSQRLPLALRRLVAPACALQAIWLLLLLLTCKVWLGFHLSPLTAAWRQWDRNNHWNLPGAPPHGIHTPPVSHGALALLLLMIAVAVVAHFWAVHQAGSVQRASRRALIWLLAATLMMGLTLVMAPILLSDDIFSYISYGRIGVVYHANALIVAPNRFPHDPFLRYVYWRKVPCVYGPVWLALADGLTLLAQGLGGSLAVYVALYKLAALAAHLVNALLIWGILTRLAPQRRLMGTLLYAWCPLPLIEFASSAHNDVLMLTWLLLGLWLMTQGRERWAICAWAAAIATKYILVLLVPVWLWYVAVNVKDDVFDGLALVWWRISAVAWRGALLLALTALLFVPVWQGPKTFAAIFAAPTLQRLNNSLPDWFVRFAPWIASAVAHANRFVVRHDLIPIQQHVALGLFAALGVWAVLRRAPRDVLAACVWMLLGYLVLMSDWFWPWYLTWPLVLVALRPLDRLTAGTLLLAGGSLTIYPFLPASATLAYGFRALLAFGPGLSYLLLGALRRPKPAAIAASTMHITPVAAE